MEVYFNIAQIIISVALIAVILLQIRSSGLGGVFGGTESAIYRTRRGIERTLFNVTIGLSIAFFVITIINVIISG
ncbi:MAG: preprotein translocase subunit SecG [Chloroflexi bacterium]|nr:MAG: preprotein translocase subunit SecG [Chloroflexota bacterium]RLC86227.1 MAG: preprotein translocase subunit SecG [Chloroflexota bacterium]HEY67950.1 preprotein translocase subunit SecG [Thermoflexia bacterium]